MTKPTISVYPERRKGSLTGWWYCEVVHNGKRFRPRYETKAEAEGSRAYYAAHLKFPDAPQTRDMGEPTFASVAAECKANRPTWKGTKDRSLGQRFEFVVGKLGHLPISQVTTRELDKLARSIPAEEGSTANRYLAVASTVLSFACDRGYLAAKPKVPRRKENEARFYWYTEEQQAAVERVLSQMGHPDHAFIVRVLAATGMRYGELEGLKADRIEDEWIRLWETKSGRSRSIPIAEDMARELRAMVSSGMVPKRTTIFHNVKAALKTCGYPEELNLHALRHTFATRLLQRGANLKKVSKLLGHSSVSMTERYAHVADEDLVETMKLLTHTRGYSGQNGNLGSGEVIDIKDYSKTA